LITEHFDGGILLEIPGELLVKIFFPKKRVGSCNWYWRRLYSFVEGGNLIPDSDGLVAMMEDQQKREIRTSFHNFV
jgi:hypothetical protein